MPSNLAHGEKEEQAWSRAKAAVKKQYPDLSEDNDRFWALANHIYQNMKSLSDTECYVEPGLVEQLVDQVQEAHLGKSRAVHANALCRALHVRWLKNHARGRPTHVVGLLRG